MWARQSVCNYPALNQRLRLSLRRFGLIPARGLLFLLQLLLLHRVFLLQLLCLLLVLLFYLLLSRFISFLLRQPLVILFLSLLEFLSFLILFRA